jgi:hypothetical protein
MAANGALWFGWGSGLTASSYGFIPTASDSANVAALQAAVNVGGVVYVSTPGNYNMNATVTLPSNVTLIFCPGCSLTKTAAFCHFFVNAGASTLTTNSYITLIGNGCELIQNGYESLTGQAYLGLRGDIAFLCVNDSTVEGFSFPDSGNTQFSVHIAQCNRIKIRNIYQIVSSGGKDVVHISGPTYDVLVDGVTTNTADDCVAINAMDYNTSAPQYGAIEKVVVRNLTDTSSTASGSFSVRTTPGSWTNWTSGNTYAPGDVVTHAGNIYFNTSAASHVAANAPVQTSGSVTGADGTTWQWKQTGAITSVNVTNVLVEDSQWASTRAFWGNYYEDTANMNSIYTGTIGNALTDQVVFRNININPYDTSERFLMDNYSCAGYVTIKDCTGTFAGTTNGNRFWNGRSNSQFLELLIQNCNLTSTSDYFIQPSSTACTLGSVVIEGGSLTGVTTQGAYSIMDVLTSGQFTYVRISNCIISNVNCLLSWSAGAVVTLHCNNCTFNGVTRIIRALNAGTFIGLFTSCDFGDPNTGLITNTAATSVKVSFVGCGGAVAANHICDSNVTLLNCDLPNSTTPAQVLGSIYRDSVKGFVQSNGTAFWPLGILDSGSVTLASGAGTITSSFITASTQVTLTRTATSGTAVAPIVNNGSGSATVAGAATDNGTYTWRVTY